MTRRAPTPDGVLAAANRITGHVAVTPLLPLDWQGTRLWIKAESLQQGGSFKLRGATNRLMRLSADERARGVVAFSSGNHAQGVALAASRLGIRAVIVMPSDAPAVKREGTLAAGALIVDYDRRREDRVAVAGRIAAETGAILVPSFDDPDVIEGQGTVGVEIASQLGALGAEAPRRVIVPCGGGGLASGIALALPAAEIVPVEPEGWDDMRRSLDLGEIVGVAADASETSCDALQTPLVSPLTFGILHGRGARGVAVSEQEVARAMFFAMHRLRLVVEPGGAVALAAILAGKAEMVGRGTVIVLSGGNVDPALYARIVAAQAAEVMR